MVGGLGQRPCTLPDTHSRDVVMLDRGQRSQAAVGSPARPPPQPGTLYLSWEEQMTAMCSEHGDTQGTSEVRVQRD